MVVEYALYFLVVSLVAYAGLWAFRRRWVLDRPWHDRIPMRIFKVPNFQGIIYILWLWVGIICFFPQLLSYQPIFQLLIIATWYGLFNFVNDIIDWRWDMTGIAPKRRLLIQILFVGIYIYISWIYQHITLFGYELGGVAWFVFALFWILGCINAINFFDGSHAMTAWVTSLWFIAIAAIIHTVVLVIYHVQWSDLSLMNSISTLCILCAISCFVYTIVEYKPWWVLRDVWMSFIGFLLWSLALLWWAKLGTMLLVLFLPICDSIRVCINRVVIMKKNPMKGDYTHLHHRMMKLWMTRAEVRWPIRIFSLTMLLMLILLGEGSIDKLILFTWLAVVFFGTHIYLYWIKKLPFELITKEKKQEKEEV